MSDKQYTHHDDQTHLEAALRRSKPWFEANATFLIYGLAAVLAVAAAIVWMQRQPEANSEVSALLMEARNPEEFQSIADKFSGTELGELARLKQAEALLNSATGKMFKDRTAAALELEQADAALNRLGDGNSADPTFNERVLIGKARLAELRCDGTEESVKAVVACWQQILDQNDAAIAKEMIERRIARLQRPEAGEFYAWFHGLEPQSADDLMIPGLPGGSFGPGAGAGPGSSVPDVPLNFDFPALPEMNDEESSEEPSTEEPATEEPATEEPATEEPATEEPATEEPATEEPATEEPATEEPATQEPSTQEPSTEEPATEEPASEESTESESEADAGE